MRILLINPIGDTQEYPAVGLAYIAASLKQRGFEARVADCNFTGENAFEAIDSYNPDVVGVSAFTYTFADAVKIAEYAKEKGKKVIMGGPHASLLKEQILKENKCIDFVVAGEGELSLPDLLAKMGKGAEKVVRSPLITDLDYLSFPDYTSLGIKTLKKYPLLTSRGCPYACTYCSVGLIMGRQWRPRKAEKVVEELNHAKEKYGVAEFHILDDNFTFNIERAKEICRLLISEKIGIPWACPNGIRADKIDEELMALMKEAGCRAIAIGVESGDPEVFKKINKGETHDDIIRAVGLCRKYGITMQGFFIIGLPGSTLAAEKRSIDFSLKLRKLGLTTAAWNMAVPYPGTALEKWVNENGRFIGKVIGRPNIQGLENEPVFETDDFTAEERKKASKLANLAWGNYWIRGKSKKQTAKNVLRTAKLILRYDAKQIPWHAVNAAKKAARRLKRK